MSPAIFNLATPVNHMDDNEQIYIRLQKHLDKQAVGFPATRSGLK